MRNKYTVWVFYNKKQAEFHETHPGWEPNGDGLMGSKTAERVASELTKSFGLQTKVMQSGELPPQYKGDEEPIK